MQSPASGFTCRVSVSWSPESGARGRGQWTCAGRSPKVVQRAGCFGLELFYRSETSIAPLLHAPSMNSGKFTPQQHCPGQVLGRILHQRDRGIAWDRQCP